jgi:hypothetical protein
MTDPATLLALAERCEQAAGPDRGLDAEIAVALFGGEIIWKAARYTMDLYPARRFQNSDYIGGYQNSGILTYTESLDAAVTLVLEGWTWARFHGGVVECMTLNGPGNSILFERGKGISTALALCAAALRARAAAHD